MQIYLPIAELSINIFLLLGIGTIVGFVAGLFGVGGNFISTPVLIFLGVSPPVAVSSSVSQVVASSFSGVMTHWRRKNVDVPMGIIMLVGSLVGSSFGVWLFGWIQSLGQIDFIIKICFIILLGFLGISMMIESVSSLIKQKKNSGKKLRGPHRHTWMHGLPLKMRFYKSGLYLSSILPFMVGAFAGIVVAIIGVSGIVAVPAMIYILGMRTQVVVGTAQFQNLFLTIYTTILHAVMNGTVDIVLALFMILGSTIGTQAGIKVGAIVKGGQLRILLAVMVLGVSLTLASKLVLPPENFFSVEIIRP